LLTNPVRDRGCPAPSQNRDKHDNRLTAHAPAVIVARKDFPATNLSEFVDYLKQSGDKLKQAHGGIGASSHMACLLFNQALGIKPTSVAYRGIWLEDTSIFCANNQ
jgi:hypothetical protein